jgi:hypothetical protein
VYQAARWIVAYTAILAVAQIKVPDLRWYVYLRAFVLILAQHRLCSGRPTQMISFA